MPGRGIGVDRVGGSVGGVLVGDDDFVITEAAMPDLSEEFDDIVTLIERRYHDGVSNHVQRSPSWSMISLMPE